MSTLGRILLVEDDPKDVELTLTALEDYNLANEVVVVRDGEEALDYLYYRGAFALRPHGNPAEQGSRYQLGCCHQRPDDAGPQRAGSPATDQVRR